MRANTYYNKHIDLGNKKKKSDVASKEKGFPSFFAFLLAAAVGFRRFVVSSQEKSFFRPFSPTLFFFPLFCTHLTFSSFSSPSLHVPKGWPISPSLPSCLGIASSFFSPLGKKISRTKEEEEVPLDFRCCCCLFLPPMIIITLMILRPLHTCMYVGEGSSSSHANEANPPSNQSFHTYSILSLREAPPPPLKTPIPLSPSSFLWCQKLSPQKPSSPPFSSTPSSSLLQFWGSLRSISPFLLLLLFLPLSWFFEIPAVKRWRLIQCFFLPSLFLSLFSVF